MKITKINKTHILFNLELKDPGFFHYHEKKFLKYYGFSNVMDIITNTLLNNIYEKHQTKTNENGI